MKSWIAVGALALPLGLAGCVSRPVVVYSAAPPPPALADPGQQGYNDGVAAAQRDLAERRPPRLDWHERYRNPPVPPPLARDYRRGFKAGYIGVLHQPAPIPGN